MPGRIEIPPTRMIEEGKLAGRRIGQFWFFTPFVVESARKKLSAPNIGLDLSRGNPWTPKDVAK